MTEDKFIFRKITSPQELQEAYKLRFQVYCRECNFIKESDYPQGYETDEFDKHSIHFGAFEPTPDGHEGRLIGSARLILSTCEKFPIEEHCPNLPINRDVVRREKCAEVSRLTISKLYRRRAHDGLYYEPQVQDVTVKDKGEYFMRRIRPMAFGLYREMYQECKRKDIRHWLALMEKTLWMLLKIHGFVFKPVGSQVDFYGMVIPYIVDIVDLEKNVYEKFPQFYAYFLENLEPELQPKF